MALNTMYYLLNNWSAGVFTNCKYTSNGLEIDYTTTKTAVATSGITSSATGLVITTTGNRISINNPTASTIVTTLSGKYDNIDFRTEYRIAVAPMSTVAEYSALDPKNFVAVSPTGFGTMTFSFSVSIPPGKIYYLFATSGQYLAVDRFYTHRIPPANASYVTELLRVKKTENIANFFLPLVEGYDMSNPKQTVPMTVEVASFANNTVAVENAVWEPVSNAVSVITPAKPYFRFRIIFPTNKLAAVSKVGYAIATNFAFTEPVSLQTTRSDVEFTAYRPSFKIFIGAKDFTRYTESCSAGTLTLNLRKVEEEFSTFYFKKVSVYLDGVEVDGGIVTRLNRTEYPNAISYSIQFTSYRDLLGASYVDNTFAFNSAQKSLNTLPFTNEFEYINYIVNYSPASNGIIINTPYQKEFRAFSFWTDDFNQTNKTGGMGFGTSPDKWTQNYIGNQKLGMEVIEQVANANMLTSEVTHTGNVILSELIPGKDKKLGFNSSYQNDIGSILSICTHRYNDYSDEHLYIPDYRLFTPDVSYDAIQAGALVHVTGTTGLGQAMNNPTEQDIGLIKGFDTGKVEYTAPGDTYNYKTQLTYSTPRDTVSFTFAANNKKTSTVEQTALTGTPKIVGLENTTYTSNAGNVIQPTILSAEHGVKLEHQWLSSALTYNQTTDTDDVYGITQMKMDIWTDDLKDEPARQMGIGLAIGIGIAILIGVTIMIAGPAAIPVIGGLFTVPGTAIGVGAAASSIYWGAMIGIGAGAGALLGAVSGSSAKVDIMLPIKVKGVPAILAHQEEFVESPLIALPDPKYFPKWAPKAYQDILLNKEALGTETRVVNNPYVVNLSGYKPLKTKQGETPEELALRQERHPYREDLAQFVASGLTLKEWLRARTVSIKYVGNPNWFPNQFIAIAKQPRLTDNKVRSYEYFYTLGAQTTSITVGGEIVTDIKAAYVGTGYLDHTSENYDIRHMNLLGD